MIRCLATLALCALILPASGAGDLPNDRKIMEELRDDLAALWKSSSPEKELQSRMKDADLRGPVGRRKYTQEFDGGVNVLGLLPGKGRRAEEVVVVVVEDPREAAGELSRSAGTGAAPWAVVLAVARQLADSPPSRSVLFVAFNPSSEPGRGAEFFAENLPVKAEAIVATVHLDALGRPHGGFMRGVVWVGGLEYCPPLEALIAAATAEAGLYVLPVNAAVLELPSSRALLTRKNVGGIVCSSGHYPGRGEESDTLEQLDDWSLLQFSKYLSSFVRLLADASGRPEFLAEPQPLRSEFSSYAIECGVLLNLVKQQNLPFAASPSLLAEAGKLRETCVRICETEPFSLEAAPYLQRGVRDLNRRLPGRETEDPPTPSPSNPAEHVNEVVELIPPATEFRPNTQQRPVFVMPEGGIEVVDVAPATPEAAAPPRPATARVAPATRVEAAAPRVVNVTRTEPRVEPPPVTEKKQPPPFLKPPNWLKQ